jgi:hypothetical protein
VLHDRQQQSQFFGNEPGSNSAIPPRKLIQMNFTLRSLDTVVLREKNGGLVKTPVSLQNLLLLELRERLDEDVLVKGGFFGSA